MTPETLKTPPSFAPTIPLPSYKIDRIIELLTKIERRLNPPFWQKALGFLLTHAITILSLLTLAYVTWQIWGIVTGMQQQVSNIVGSIGKMKLW